MSLIHVLCAGPRDDADNEVALATHMLLGLHYHDHAVSLVIGFLALKLKAEIFGRGP